MLEVLDGWIVAIAGCMSLGSVVYSWLTWRARENAGAISELDESHEDIEQRIGRIETAQAAFAAKIERRQSELENSILKQLSKEVGDVHRRVDSISDAVSRVEGEVKQIGQVVKLINQHLLRQGGGKS